jgi:hypothetical protein
MVKEILHGKPLQSYCPAGSGIFVGWRMKGTV